MSKESKIPSATDILLEKIQHMELRSIRINSDRELTATFTGDGQAIHHSLLLSSAEINTITDVIRNNIIREETPIGSN